MKTHALISLNPATFIEFKDGPANTKAGFAIVPYSREDAPENVNQLTHKLESKRTVTAQAVVDGFEVVALTVGEAKIAAFNAAVNAGFDTGLGYSLKLYDHDRAAFTQLLVLVNEAVNAGAMTEQSTVDIWDTEGVKHTVAVSLYRQLILGYGAYYQAINAAKE
jgi:hypothetical protein